MPADQPISRYTFRPIGWCSRYAYRLIGWCSRSILIGWSADSADIHIGWSANSADIYIDIYTGWSAESTDMYIFWSAGRLNYGIRSPGSRLFNLKPGLAQASQETNESIANQWTSLRYHKKPTSFTYFSTTESPCHDPQASPGFFFKNLDFPGVSFLQQKTK